MSCGSSSFSAAFHLNSSRTRQALQKTLPNHHSFSVSGWASTFSKLMHKNNSKECCRFEFTAPGRSCGAPTREGLHTSELHNQTATNQGLCAFQPSTEMMIVVLAALLGVAVVWSFPESGNPITEEPPLTRPNTAKERVIIFENAPCTSWDLVLTSKYTPPTLDVKWSKVILDFSVLDFVLLRACELPVIFTVLQRRPAKMGRSTTATAHFG
jgi:hypothetical protein